MKKRFVWRYQNVLNKKKMLALWLTLAITGCGGLTGLSANAELFTACFSYARALEGLGPFKFKMKESQVANVRSVIRVVSPLCKRGFVAEDTLGTLLIVRDGLLSLNELQRKVE